MTSPNTLFYPYDKKKPPFAVGQEEARLEKLAA